MPGDSSQNGRQRRSRTHALILLVAGLWLLILFTCIAADPWSVAAASTIRSGPIVVVASASVPTSTPTDIPTTAVVTATATATATATSVGANPTATVAAVATATVAAVATDTPIDTGAGGGGGDGGYQGSGPQPTRVVLAQPTAGSGSDIGAQGLSPAAFGSNGLLVAMTLSCVVSILGLVIAIIALNMLIRGGYGPFLRVLLLGNRAGSQSASDVAPASATGGGRSGRWTSWDDEGGGRNDGRNSRGGGAQRRGAPVPSRAAPRQAPPVSRSRPDWR